MAIERTMTKKRRQCLVNSGETILYSCMQRVYFSRPVCHRCNNIAKFVGLSIYWKREEVWHRDYISW